MLIYTETADTKQCSCEHQQVNKPGQLYIGHGVLSFFRQNEKILAIWKYEMVNCVIIALKSSVPIEPEPISIDKNAFPQMPWHGVHNDVSLNITYI